MFRLDGIDTHITSHGLAQICEWVNLNPLSANITKWSNTLKQFVGKLRTNCLSMFDHFVGLTLKGLISEIHWTRVKIFLYHLLSSFSL